MRFVISKKKVSTKARARFASPEKPDNGDALVALTNQQVTGVMACADYVNQPTVQAAAKQAESESNALGQTLGKLGQAKLLVQSLESTRDAQIASLKLSRHGLAAAITVVSGGVAETIKSWGAEPASSTPAAATNEPPGELAAKPDVVLAGAIDAKCAKVHGAVSYLWCLLGDPNAPPSSVQPVITTRTRVKLPGQPVGHVMYLRVACVRPNGGQSLWSEAVQVTVR